MLKLGLRYSGHLSSKWVCLRSPISENNCGHVEGIWWFLHPYILRIRHFCLLLDFANLLHELVVPKISRPSSFSTVVAVKFFDRRLCGLFLEIFQPLHVQLMLVGFLWGHRSLGSSGFHEWRHCSTWRFLVTYHVHGWGKVISGRPTVGCHHPSQPSWLWRTRRIKETLWCGEMCWVTPLTPSKKGVDMSKSLRHLDFRHLLQFRQSGNIVIVHWLAPSKRDQPMYSVKSNAVRMVSFRFLGGKTRPPRGTSWVARTCYCFQFTHGQNCVVFVAKKVIFCCIFWLLKML